MEILILLRANWRKKKGTFISIAVLMTIITALATAIFSVRHNYEKGIEQAMETADYPDTIVNIKEEVLNDEICEMVENSRLVEHIDCYLTICANGISCGDITDNENCFLYEMRDGIKLYKQGEKEFETTVPRLKSGEIYLPLGMMDKIKCNVGDCVTIDLLDGIMFEFTIKGFVQEPSQGALTIGWKQVFISQDDFEKIYRECKPFQTEDITLGVASVFIYQSKDSGLSPIKFQRELNLETKIIDISLGALNKDQSIRYSTLMPDIILDIVMVFVGFLFVIVLIVMSHSISTEIQTDYMVLGILKSQGFENGKIKRLFFLQYMIAEIVGIMLGFLGAVPIERIVSSVFQSVTGVLPVAGLSLERSILYILIIFFCSAVIIFIKTHQLVKISPVRAILGGNEDIYFDSRLNIPISKKMLAGSLALRQFTFNKKQYIGTIMIAAILTFFMITVNLLGVLLSSETALYAMGAGVIPDIEIYPNGETDGEYMSDMEKIVESYSEITEKNRRWFSYVSLNGENLACDIYENPDYIYGILKGREPRYDNEILITEMVMETLDLKMGDKVIISHGNQEMQCIISGIYQTVTDSGMCLAANFETAQKIGIDVNLSRGYFVIKDKSKLSDIADEIRGRYGDIFEVKLREEGTNYIVEQYGEIVSLLKLIIYTFSVLFAFVVVRMVCTKTFGQERRNIGIFKAMGFTSQQLRFSFAVRFLIVAIIGAGTGAIFSILFSAKMLSIIFKLMGLSRVVLEFTVLSLLIPVLAVGIGFFLFAYLTSGRIRAVEVKELILE